MAKYHVTTSSLVVSTPTRHDTTDTTDSFTRHDYTHPGMSLRDVARELGQPLTTIDRLYHDATDVDGGDQ